jgi:hypothetical protein
MCVCDGAKADACVRARLTVGAAAVFHGLRFVPPSLLSLQSLPPSSLLRALWFSSPGLQRYYRDVHHLLGRRLQHPHQRGVRAAAAVRGVRPPSGLPGRTLDALQQHGADGAEDHAGHGQVVRDARGSFYGLAVPNGPALDRTLLPPPHVPFTTALGSVPHRGHGVTQPPALHPTTRSITDTRREWTRFGPQTWRASC